MEAAGAGLAAGSLRERLPPALMRALRVFLSCWYGEANQFSLGTGLLPGGEWVEGEQEAELLASSCKSSRLAERV